MYGCSSCEKPAPVGLPEQHPQQQKDSGIYENPQKEAADSERPPEEGPSGPGHPIPAPAWEVYSIPRGDHYNDLRSFSFFQGDTLRFRFVMDSSAFYSTKDPKNQADWNKLMGFSDCGSFHHTNSIRLVWRNYHNQLEIGEYRYTNGKREYSTLGSVVPGDTNLAEIVATPNAYKLRLNDILAERKRSCNGRSSSYWLYPYFGGDEPAPAAVHIAIQHLVPRL